MRRPAAALPARDPGAHPRAQQPKSLLRFITCGSVDDGKSTLIGRLLHDSKLILDDQLSTLVTDSARHGTTGEDIDFALLVDGLEAEREQGITIDVAYRFFATARPSSNVTRVGSMRMIAACAVEAPVTMLRVYCSWPGVSAMMNLRLAVAK